MARKPRVYGTSGFYHVILRGNNKQNLFNDDIDRKFFIGRLRKYSKELKIHLCTYPLFCYPPTISRGTDRGKCRAV